MLEVGNIIRCISGRKIGERLLVEDIVIKESKKYYQCSIICTGLFDTVSSVSNKVEVSDVDFREFCIVEER